jgi:hypothetical protein
MHRDKQEDCDIGYSNGNIYHHLFSVNPTHEGSIVDAKKTGLITV